MFGYRTKLSDIHTRSSRSRYRGFILSVTSWPIMTPRSSTISIVTQSGLGNSEVQNMTKRSEHEAQVWTPAFSNLSPQETLHIDSSILTTSRAVERSNGSMRNTPARFPRCSRNSSCLISWHNHPTCIK